VTTTTGTDRLLLDAGVWIDAKKPDSLFYAASRALAVDPGYPVAALDLTMLEVANVLGARDGRPEEALDMCRLVSGRCGHAIVPSDPTLIRTALGIVEAHGLSAYDAAYVAAARREDWTLVSLDIKDLVSKGFAITPDAAV
jgi:predicted nucleic acid-binding protein